MALQTERQPSVRERLAIAPTIDTSGVAQTAQTMHNLQSYKQGVMDKREKEYLALVDVPFINTISDTNRQKQLQKITKFNDKWKETYTEMRGKLTPDQKLQIQSEKRDIMQFQGKLLRDQDEFEEATKIMNTSWGRKYFDPQAFYEGAKKYKDTGEFPIEGLLQPKPIMPAQMMNEIIGNVGQTQAWNVKQNVKRIGDDQQIITSEREFALTPEQTWAQTEAVWAQTGSRAQSLDRHWTGELTPDERKMALEEANGDQELAKELAYKAKLRTDGTFKENIRNAPGGSSSKINWSYDDSDIGVPVGGKGLKVTGGTIVSHDKANGTVTVEKKSVIPFSENEIEWKDDYVNSVYGKEGQEGITTYQGLQDAIDEAIKEKDEKEADRLKKLKDNVDSAWAAEVRKYEENPKYDANTIEYVVEPDTKYIDRLKASGADVTRKKAQNKPKFDTSLDPN